jgi:acetyl-CoA acetyltransferase
MATENAPASMYREGEGLGVWEHRGKVAAVGIGHSPTTRRWDETAETSLGAWSILALRNALEDAGVSADQVDGLVISPSSLGESWAPRPIPEDFANMFQLTDVPNDGLSQLSSEWILKNTPELTNVKYTAYGPGCMSNAICVAAQAVGDGLTNTCVVLTGRNNLAGRYGQAGANALDTISGPAQFVNPWGPTGPTHDALTFSQYLHKYNVTHDMFAPFVVNEKRNGLLFPEGFFAQNRPEDVVSIEDYNSARWIVKPLNLYDCDIPMCVSVAYVFTTADRAKDMKQKPVYILNHASTKPKYGVWLDLDGCELSTDATARKMYAGSGLGPNDVDIENMYDGYTTFHNYYLEALQWHGVKRGEALHFYQGDISVEGPHPISSSGGNAGSGRTRIWMHTDSIQQLQGRAGARQVHIKNGRPETAISGGPMPQTGDFVMWGTSPD